jgi:hypothetical protein
MVIVIESVSNPVYCNGEGTAINCTVKFQHLPEPVEFTATSYDVEAHGVQLYNSLIAGEFGSIAPYVPPTIPVVEVGA